MNAWFFMVFMYGKYTVRPMDPMGIEQITFLLFPTVDGRNSKQPPFGCIKACK